MVKYCPECGHLINDPKAQFCPKCGVAFPSTASTNESIPVQKTQQQGPTIVVPKEDLSILKGVAIFFGGLILLFILMVFIGGVSQGVFESSISSSIPAAQSTSTSEPSVGSSNPIVTKNLSDVALTINDLPTGWSISGNSIITPNTYGSKFKKVNGAPSYIVYQILERNTTVEQAMNSYNTRKAAITQYKVESVNLGDEGFGYVNADSSIVVFRKGNIIVTTQYGAVGIGATWDDRSINDAKQYAEIISDRIQS